MTEAEWVASENPTAMLRWLIRERPAGVHQCNSRKLTSDRKLRLFASACSGNDDAWVDWCDLKPSHKGVMSAEDGASHWSGIKVGQTHCLTLTDADKRHRAALLRDVFGNPWRQCQLVEQPVESLFIQKGIESFQRSRLTWNDGAAHKLAQAMCDANDFAEMPQLAELLEEAGCEPRRQDAEVINHCLGLKHCPYGGPTSGVSDFLDWVCEECNGSGWSADKSAVHVRGCWAIDLLIGLT